MADLRRHVGTSLNSYSREEPQSRDREWDNDRDRDKEDENNSPRVKRRRTAVACSACRVRKSRCNGRRPKCSLCDNLGLECVYDSGDTSVSPAVSKETVIELQSRLYHLEQAVRKHEQALLSNDLLRLGGDDSGTYLNRGYLPAPSDRNPRALPNDTAGLRSADLQDTLPESPPTDGMAITYINEEDSGYFGQTSNIAFMRHISRAMVMNGNQEGLTSPPKSDDSGLIDSGIVNISRLPSPILGTFPKAQNQAFQGVMLNTLPSESVTRGLIEKYFSNTGRLFPYIHAPSFWETYEQMKANNFTKSRRTWLGLLNMVLAMASNANVENQIAKERLVQSDEYYQRALGLCQTQILRGSSLETVQYLLLMSQYLQGTQKSVQTWAIHGLAVKAAMSIGLHSSDASRSLSPIEREFRYRAWFGCVVLDRTLSMTFGRPMTIPEEHVQLPLPQPENYGLLGFTVGESPVTEEMRSVMFFNSTITLYKIMGKVIATLYGGNLGCGPLMPRKDMASAIFQFEQEIDEWNHSLPAFLHTLTSYDISSSSPDDPAWMRYQVILSLRCLNLQVLLYRPVLIRSIDRSAEVANHSTTMRSMDQIERNHIDSCLTSAKEIIDIVHKIITAPGLGKNLLGAWWFSLYYVFNAALMTFGSLLANSKHINNSDSSNQVAACRLILARAIKAIRLLDEENVIVTRCALFIEQMAHKLDAASGSVSDVGVERSVGSIEGLLRIDRAGNAARMVRFLSPRRQLDQERGLSNEMLQNQDAGGPGFLLGNGYTDQLELSQFFLGDGMEPWVDNQG